MWRRVSCEQLLDTSQAILRLRGSPIKLCGVLRSTRVLDRNFSRKGMRSLFLTLVAEPIGPRTNTAT